MQFQFDPTLDVSRNGGKSSKSLTTNQSGRQHKYFNYDMWCGSLHKIRWEEKGFSECWCQENNQIISLFPINYVRWLCYWYYQLKRTHTNSQIFPRKFISIFYLWPVGSERPFMHESLSAPREKNRERIVGTDRIIKSFLWKIEIMNINKK
jgi:hypothetical protein